jgi:hypothetical protein
MLLSFSFDMALAMKRAKSGRVSVSEGCYPSSSGFLAGGADIALRAIVFAFGAHCLLLPEISGRVAGKMSRTVMDWTE